MKPRNTFSVLFYVRKDNPNRKEEVPIYCRITINSKQVRFALNRFIKPDKWSLNSARYVKGSNEEAQKLNFHLDKVKSKLLQIHSDLQTNGKLVTPQIVRDIFHGKSIKQKSLVEILDRFINKIETRIGIDYELSTLKKYQATKKHIIECLKTVSGKSDVYISELNNSFIFDFENYLKVTRKCSHNSAMKYIKLFKTFIKNATDNGILEVNPFSSFKTSYNEVNREVLTLDEVKKISSIILPSEALEEIRDVFVFCCYTGLAYVDVHKLSSNNITTGLDGIKQISIARTKTETLCNIPLLDNAKVILDKYANHPVCLNKGTLLPVRTNQKYNVNLKHIASICGVNKNLTTHIARHTFATMLLNQDFPIEVVSKLLGHTKIATTQIYAKIQDTTVSRKMNQLNEKFKNAELQIA